MPIQPRIQSLSKETRSFLSSGETDKVDFKKVAKGLSAEDLVAFANADGGQILVGVQESQAQKVQIGEVVGCDVSDRAILEILNKATSCIPPVSLDIFIENLSKEPILRIVIPSSETKPHCTPKGIYCRRDGTRTRSLHPQEMLKIFLEIEARSFASKFEAAAEKIGRDLADLESSLEETIGRMGDQLGWAEFKLGDTEDTVDAILARVALAQRDARDANTRIRSLFRQDDRLDPVRERHKNELIPELIEQIVNDPELLKVALRGGELSGSLTGIRAIELTEDDLKQAMSEAIKAIEAEIEKRKYSRVIAPPNDCSEKQIDQFVELVAMGGEVADGVRNRTRRAKTLGFVEYDGVPVGVAAVKRPLKNYKKKVFKESRSPLDVDEFSLELGWIYLKENHRGKGQMTPLIEQMLDGLRQK
tara:strand:- start:2370 stop:3626 length:1257 start_codon:yes stop_codon:yes gene_type:complete